MVNLSHLNHLGRRMVGDQKNLVYIEDDQEMIELVDLILKPYGYMVSGALGGLEGIEKVKKVLPDMILLDLLMPDMDGWDVYHQLKSNPATRDIPVIVITARADNIDKVLGLQIAKVDDYIAKPFTTLELLDSLRRVFEKQGGIKSEV